MEFGQEIQLSYELLKEFVQNGLRLAFDEPQPGADHGELNIIVLRGAIPISDFGADPPSKPQAVLDMLRAEAQRNNTPIIRLVPNIHNEYNDTTVFAWKDTEGTENVRAFPGTADPGEWSYQQLRKGKRPHPYKKGEQRLVAHIGAGQHIATWGWHYSESRDEYYECLDIFSEGQDGVWGFRKSDPNDPESKVIFEVIGGIQLHAGGSLGQKVYDWSDGCVAMCTGGISDFYRFIMGEWVYTSNPRTLTHKTKGLIEIIEGPAHKKKEGETDYEVDEGYSWRKKKRYEEMNRNRRYAANREVEINVIVWNAWALLQYKEYKKHPFLSLKRYNPVVPMGAHDPPGLGEEGWVHQMQLGLYDKIRTGLQAGEENWKNIVSVLPGAPFPAYVEPDGKFGVKTLHELKAFQLLCAAIIQHPGLALKLDDSISVDDQVLLRERNEWICGPETWKLLETEKFLVSKVE